MRPPSPTSHPRITVASLIVAWGIATPQVTRRPPFPESPLDDDFESLTLGPVQPKQTEGATIDHRRDKIR